MCDLSVKVTHVSRANPLASRDSFRERCQGAPSGCAVLFFTHEYAPHFTQVKASLRKTAALDAERNLIQLPRQYEISQGSRYLFPIETKIVFSGTKGAKLWPFFFLSLTSASCFGAEGQQVAGPPR